ncbi:MAG: integrating conjugative element protein [Alphaproteobacteria bacterium]|nr:integrating conjugative element protein [Alphaproteobacteria bacterium]
MKLRTTGRRLLAAATAAAIWACAPAALADDEFLYRLGGAEPISLGPSARASTLRLGIGAEWNANLTCGNFDVAHSIRQQLNGVSGAFQDVMGNVIQTAQGVVASLPALAIQRLNPGLYDLLQNGVLEAGQEFRVAKLRCDEIADEMGDTLAHEGWSGIARGDYWRRQANVGGRDVVEVVGEADGAAGADGGVPWIGGSAAGGAGQEPIEAVGDVSKAGYNLLLGRAAADDSAVGPTACGDSDICKVWDDPDAMAAWMRRVVGEIEVRTCDGCRKVAAQAGLGLPSAYRREKSALANILRPLAQTDAVPSQSVLDGLTGGGGFRVTRGVIEAIRDEPRPADVADRLAGELAVGRVMEQAAMARRALLAGMREPNVANNEAALRQSERALVELDREIRQMEVELRVKALVASNSSVAVLQRAGIRKRIPVWEASPGGGLREGAPE